MSQEKAQLIAPLGHFTVPGLNVSGVVTATSFSGNCTGTASSIAKGTNVVVGVMTASSFVGDVTGNVTGIGSNTDNLDVGVVTATSFAGNFTGIGSGLTGTPNVVAGVVTATKFVGNTPGTVSKLADGTNINVGVVTATKFVGNTSGLAAGIAAAQNINVGVLTATGGLYGDGSGLTGAGSTAYIRQSVSSGTTALGPTTTNINLNDGNIINFEHVGSPTLSFFNAKTADDITIIRSLTTPTTEISTGAVDFDGTDDYLSMSSSSDLSFGTGDYTVECWIYPESVSGTLEIVLNTGGDSNTTFFFHYDQDQLSVGNQNVYISNQATTFSNNTWYHIAACRSGTTLRLFKNGAQVGSDASDTIDWASGGEIRIGRSTSGQYVNGKISNLRVVKGTALYTSGFTPSSTPLTNITNTKLLCCQDSSSSTTAAVKPGTITANNSPTVGTATPFNRGLGTELTWPTSVTWNGGSAPTLAGINRYSLTGQVFNLVTADGGTTWYGYEEVNNTVGYSFNKLYAWGQNTGSWGIYGQLGLNDTVSRSSPTQIPGTNWSKLASNTYFSNSMAVIKADGTLWAWGYQQGGHLGQNNLTTYSSPIQIPGTTWAEVSVVSGGSVLQGKNSMYGIKTDNTLWTWGMNENGRLGQNNSANSAKSSPTQIPGTTWSKITGSSTGITAAVKTDGTLWSWGYNGQGGLGQNNDTQYSSPVQVGSDTTWASCLAGSGSMSAIKTDGTLWTWGGNPSGQLGHNNNTNYSSPVQIPGSWKIGSGMTGFRDAGGVKTDGTAWSWGFGSGGVHGINQPGNVKRSSPTQIPGTTWSQVIINSYYSNGLKTDGTLWSWGYQYHGTLGTNQSGPAYVSSPVQVPGTDWTALPVKMGPYKSFAFKSV